MSERIGIDPDINGGKPTVAGTCVSVQTVLGHLSAGDELQDVLAARRAGLTSRQEPSEASAPAS